MMNAKRQKRLVQCTEHKRSEQAALPDKTGNPLQDSRNKRPDIISCNGCRNRYKRHHNNHKFRSCKKCKHGRKLRVHKPVVHRRCQKPADDAGENPHIISKETDGAGPERVEIQRRLFGISVCNQRLHGCGLRRPSAHGRPVSDPAGKTAVQNQPGKCRPALFLLRQ